MFTPRETATIAAGVARRVADERVRTLRGMGAEVVVAEAGGTSPGVRLEVDYGGEGGWTEFVESSCVRGAHAFDVEYLNALRSTGWVVLHYPRGQISEEFARMKAEELLELAIGSGMDRAEVWVYLYDRHGGEERIT